MSDRRIRELYRSLADDPSDEAARVALVAEERRSRADVRADLFKALRDQLAAIAARPPWTVAVRVGLIDRPDPRPRLWGGVTLTDLRWRWLSKPRVPCVVGVHEPTQTVVPLPERNEWKSRASLSAWQAIVEPPSDPDPDISALGTLLCVHDHED